MRFILSILFGALLFTTCNVPTKNPTNTLAKAAISKQKIIAQEDNFTISESWFEQPVNHETPNDKTFEQQIFTLHPKGLTTVKKVFFVLGNETDATAQNLVNWYKGYGSPKELVFILAEHRGYGQSITKEDQTKPTYVTRNEAMKDYHRLLPHLKAQYPVAAWAGVGYSYGGALVLNYAYLYPDDFDAILSSSPPTKFPFLIPQYSEQIYENLGTSFTNRLAVHLKNLKPDTLFDSKWKDREMLSGLVGGLTQMAQFEALIPIVEKMSALPTDSFIVALKNILPQEGLQYAESRALKHLSYEMAQTGKYNWYTWKWQQCYECGTFFYGLPFSYTKEEIIADCAATFQEQPAFFNKEPWSIEPMLGAIKQPIVMVVGGKDPWLKIGMPPNRKYEKIHYIYDSKANHVPDKFSKKLGEEAIQLLINELNKK